jgi:hypothetical protein
MNSQLGIWTIRKTLPAGESVGEVNGVRTPDDASGEEGSSHAPLSSCPSTPQLGRRRGKRAGNSEGGRTPAACFRRNGWSAVQGLSAMLRMKKQTSAGVTEVC